jgi:hypothetical protein
MKRARIFQRAELSVSDKYEWTEQGDAGHRQNPMPPAPTAYEYMQIGSLISTIRMAHMWTCSAVLRPAALLSALCMHQLVMNWSSIYSSTIDQATLQNILVTAALMHRVSLSIVCMLPVQLASCMHGLMLTVESLVVALFFSKRQQRHP